MKKKTNVAYGSGNHKNDKLWKENDVQFMELQDHTATYTNIKLTNIPLQIISPITYITWMWMCRKWRKHFDFNFKRSSNWDNNSPIRKFNHCWYLKYHKVLDWHDFVLLRNKSFIYKGVIVDPQVNRIPKTYWYVKKVEYSMPPHLLNVKTVAEFRKVNDKDWFKPICKLYYCRLWQRLNQWVLDAKQHAVIVTSDCKWVIPDRNLFKNCTVKHDGVKYVDYTIPLPQTQDNDVASNRPFIFAILGMDKYSHTKFTGLRSMDTHGYYSWIANYHCDLQFTHKYTYINCQAPGILPLQTVLPKLYEHWQYLMHQGCLLWNGLQLQQVKGMISHHIGDMQDKDILMRRRGEG